MISLSPDNKTINVTCEVAKSSLQPKCLVTLNCTSCHDDPITSKSFTKSIQLAVKPGEYYVIIIQVVRADNNELLEEYVITIILQIPKTSQHPNGLSTYILYRNFQLSVDYMFQINQTMMMMTY